MLTRTCSCLALPPYGLLALCLSKSKDILYITIFDSNILFSGCKALFFLFLKIFCVFLHHLPRYHDLVSTAQTFQPEICSHPEYFPFSAAAGMLFFQFQYISHINIHNIFLFFSCLYRHSSANMSRQRPVILYYKWFAIKSFTTPKASRSRLFGTVTG